MKKLSLLTAAATLLFAGACSNDDGGAAESVSEAIPPTTYKGRTEQVLVVGNGTDWQAGSTVDFGEGVTVDSVMVASPTTLVVSISTDGATAAGARDITVNGSTTLTGGFEVLDAAASASQGTTAQGSISVVNITGLDVMTPFDTTQTGDGLFEPIAYPNVAIDGLPQGVSMNVGFVASYELSATLLVDVSAAAGTYSVDVVSGPPENQVRIPVEVTIAERSPIALTADTMASDTVSAPFDSQLYSITVPSGAIALPDISALGADQQFILLGASGSFAEIVDVRDSAIGAPLVQPGDYYVVLWDSTGTADYDFSFTPFVANMPAAAEEAEPNDDSNSAQVLDLPAQIGSATMSLADDDVYTFTAGPQHIGQIICIGTFGNPQTDTTIEIVHVAADDTKTLFAESNDFGFQDTLITAPLEAEGTYLVRVRPSSFHEEGLPEDYSLAVWTE
jgi:hypothetical protein